MDISDLFQEEDLLCPEGFSGYDNELYCSPAHSDDSGFSGGQSYALDTLLCDVLSPVSNNFDFSDVTDCTQSPNVSPNFHDHTYSLTQTLLSTDDFNESQYIHETSSGIKAKVNIGNKRKLSSSSDVFVVKDENLPEVKRNCKESKDDDDRADEFKQIANFNIDIIKCDDETFSYKNEEGKVIVVDRSRKNAEMARLNRQRKKKYVASLESEIKSLRGQNAKLSQLKIKQESKIEKLEDEVSYLMSVIRNQTMLSSVLKAVSNVPGVKLGEGSGPSDHRPRFVEKIPGKRIPFKEDSDKFNGGVCLHVSENKVSLEFCSKCNKEQ